MFSLHYQLFCVIHVNFATTINFAMKLTEVDAKQLATKGIFFACCDDVNQ